MRGETYVCRVPPLPPGLARTDITSLRVAAGPLAHSLLCAPSPLFSPSAARTARHSYTAFLSSSRLPLFLRVSLAKLGRGTDGGAPLAV